MPQINETIFAPALDGGEWIQHGPVNLKELRGRMLPSGISVTPMMDS